MQELDYRASRYTFRQGMCTSFGRNSLILIWSGLIELKSTSSDSTNASAEVCSLSIFILSPMATRSSTRDFSVTITAGGQGGVAVVDVEGKDSGVLDEFGLDTAMLSEVKGAAPYEAADTIALLTWSRV